MLVGEKREKAQGGTVGITIVKSFVCEPSSVPEARAALSPLEPRVDPATFETLRVLVSELVTNSVLQALTAESEDVELAVSATRERIRVEVSDPRASWLAASHEADREAGWGLQLVDAFSDRWGTKNNGHTAVWFELVDSGAFAHRTRLAVDRSE
jgi:two-component sensor histidine kinase